MNENMNDCFLISQRLGCTSIHQYVRMPATPANNLIQVTGYKFSETSDSFQQSQAEVTGYK